MTNEVRELKDRLYDEYRIDVEDTSVEEIIRMNKDLTDYANALTKQQEEYDKIAEQIKNFFLELKQGHPTAEIYFCGTTVVPEELDDDIEIC